MEKLGIKSWVEVSQGIKTGDTIRAKLAGCVNAFQKRISKNGNKYAFLELSDATSNFEGLLFSEGLTKYEDVINSGQPLMVSITIDKQNEEASPRVMFNLIETLDAAIAGVSNGLEIEVGNIEAIPELKNILGHDMNGKNKIYIKPIHHEWDVRIVLAGGYALASDVLNKIRNVPGVTSIKEI